MVLGTNSGLAEVFARNYRSLTSHRRPPPHHAYKKKVSLGFDCWVAGWVSRAWTPDFQLTPLNFNTQSELGEFGGTFATRI